MEIAAFVAIVVVFIVLGVYGYRQAQKRLADLQAWAAGRGLSFAPANDFMLDSRFPNHSTLHQGSSRYGYNIMRGRVGERDVCAFDYHYATYSTDSKGNRQTHHHHFSAVMVQPNLPLKPLYIRREGFFDKLTSAIGFDDIDFESAQFSREFHVKAADRRWAFDVLHQRAMEFLLESPRFTLDFQFDGVLVTGSGCFKPEEFEAALGVVNGLLDLLPESVVRELQGAE